MRSDTVKLLDVQHLVVEFPGRRGTLRALDDISFDIAPGISAASASARFFRIR